MSCTSLVDIFIAHATGASGSERGAAQRESHCQWADGVRDGKSYNFLSRVTYFSQSLCSFNQRRTLKTTKNSDRDGGQQENHVADSIYAMNAAHGHHGDLGGHDRSRESFPRCAVRAI